MHRPPLTSITKVEGVREVARVRSVEVRETLPDKEWKKSIRGVGETGSR